MRDFRGFLEHERHVLLNNIERLEDGLNLYSEDDPLASGHLKMLDVQKRHLAMLDTLIEGDIDPQLALITCEETLKLAEAKHQKLIQQGLQNDERWWETLDVIQFISRLIYRIEDWQKRYQADSQHPVR